jgi:hypothetical protein
MSITPTEKKINIKFKQFYKNIRDILESYNLIEFYIPHLHIMLKNKSIPSLIIYNPTTRKIENFSKKDTFGAIDHLKLKANPRRTLIDMVSTTEHYLSKISSMVYLDFPERFLINDEDDKPERIKKLSAIIVNSSCKEEMIDIIIEEKIRNLFYGNPIDFFTKKKMKFQFDSVFISSFSKELELYAEIIARRNIYTHNGGRVDRKYLREVKGSSYKLETLLKLDRDYLINSFHILVGFAATATYFILKNIYGKKSSGQIEFIYKQFMKSTSQSVLTEIKEV